MSAASASADGAAPGPSSREAQAERSAFAATYERSLSSDAAQLVDSVNTYLPLAFYYHDEERVSFYLRRVQQLLSLKAGGGVCGRDVKEGWIRLLWTQLLEQAEKLNMHVQIKILTVLCALFQHEKGYALALEWRPLYAYLSRYHLLGSTRSMGTFTAEMMYAHQTHVVKLVAKARRYFVSGGKEDAAAAQAASGGYGATGLSVGSPKPLSAGEEILATFIPFLCPFDNAYFKSQALLCLFFPSHLELEAGEKRQLPEGAGPGATPTSYKQLTRLYTPFTSNLIDICPLTIILNLQLYARMAKHGLGVEDESGRELLAPFFQQHRASFFSTFLQILELDISNKHSANSHRSWTAYTTLTFGTHRPARLDDAAAYIAKLIVYTLHTRDEAPADGDSEAATPTTQSLLTSLLFTLRNYYHPSNASGHAGSVLASFLSTLTQVYTKRVCREIRGDVKYDKKYYLDPSNLDLLLVVQPIAMQGLYSKSASMVAACESALRNLSVLHPQHILPQLIGNIEQSLIDVNTSHRMMSSLQVMCGLANVIYSSEINVGTGGGANYLPSMMALCLPGIDVVDPIKTSFTLTWLTVLFYSLPMVDARDGGHGQEDVRLPALDSLTPAQRYSLQDQHPTEDEYAEAVENARTATMGFEEWALSYCDVLVRLLASADKFAKRDYVDQAFARLLYKNTRTFFSALSPKIYEAVLDKLVKVVCGSHLPSAQKQYGILVHTLSLANTDKFLAKLLPAMLKKVLVGNALATTLAASELEWCIYLMGQAVKQAGGAAACADATAAGIGSNLLLPYVDQLELVYTLTHAHETKAVRKASAKLIRNLLKGLTFTYPAEWRNYSPVDDWSALTNPKGGRKGGWAHWRAWGTWAPKEEPYDALPSIDGIWHIPSAEERAVAARLVQTNLRAPLTWLANWIDGKENPAASPSSSASSAQSDAVSSVGKSDSPLERSIYAVTNLCRGITPVLGSMEGADSAANLDVPGMEDDHDLPYTAAGADCGSRCPLVMPRRTQPVPPLDASMVPEVFNISTAEMAKLPKVTSLRSHLARILHQAFVRLRALSAHSSVQLQPSTKAHTLLLKLTAQVLAGYGINERKAHTDRSNGKYARQRLRELLSGYRCRMRPMLQQKCWDIHQNRMVELSYYETYTADVAALVADLHLSAVNDFSRVRAKATTLLIGACRRYPQAIDGTLDAMLSVFANPTGKSSDETLLGCMGVLADYSMTGWMSRKWFRMRKFIETFFRHGEKHKDDKVQLLVQQLYNNLYSSFTMKPVALEPVSGEIPAPVRHLVDAPKVARRNQSIQRYNKKLSRNYMELVTFLYHHASGSGSGVGGGDAASNSSGAAPMDTSANGSASAKQPAHWRYSLMSAAFFFSLSRAQHYATALATVDSTDGLISWHQYASFFLRGTTSSLAPLRTISFLAVNKLLGTHTLFVRKELQEHAEAALRADVVKTLQTLDTGATTPIDPAASLSKQGSILTFTDVNSEQEQLDTVWYDFLYSGWMGDTHNTVVCKYLPPMPEGKYAHWLPHAYFTPLSLVSPLKYPYKQMPSTPHTPVAPLAPATLQSIYDFYTRDGGRNLQLLVDHFVHAHPSLAPSNEGAHERSGDGAGDQIASLAKRGVVRNRFFPVTRFNKKSGSFKVVHVNLIRGLVENFPQMITEAPLEGNSILGLVKNLLKTPDEADKACTAAELLCGATLAIKHFRFDVRRQCESQILPVLTQALQSCMPENLDHYGDALRHIYTNMDPRRNAWLSRTLFAEALHELPSSNFDAENAANAMTAGPDILDFSNRANPAQAGMSPSTALATDFPDLKLGSPAASPSPSPSTPPPRMNSPGAAMGSASAAPSVQFKRLRFLLPALIEVGYRGTKLGEWLITQFKSKGYLASPWKQVREEVSWILFILSRNEFQLSQNHPAQSPGGSVTEPASTLSVVSSPVYLQFLHYISMQLDQVKELYREERSHPAGSPKLMAIAHAAAAATPATNSNGGSGNVDAHVETAKSIARNFLETVLTWFHATNQCGDSVFTSTAYQAFLPYVLWAQHHPDAEISAIARYAGTGAAWISAGGSALSRESAGGESKHVTPAHGVRRLQEAAGVPEVPSLSLRSSEPRRTALNSPSRVMSHILSSLRATALNAENSWHVRVAVARFLQIWLPRHSLAFDAEQLSFVESLLLDVLLVDPQVEVRDAAAHALQSFVSSSFPLQLPTRDAMEERAHSGADGGGGGMDEDGGEGGAGGPARPIVLKPHPHVERMATKLQKLVRRSSGKKAATLAPAAALAQRHGGLLGLSSLASIHPYDLPSHLPALLSFLAPHIQDRHQSISGALRKFFTAWRASHKDEWAHFQRQFSEEQLEEINAVESAPSYFA